MNGILLLQYILSLAIVALVTAGLSRLKKALLCHCRNLKKPSP